MRRKTLNQSRAFYPVVGWGVSPRSLTEPEAPAAWNVGIPTVASGGESCREV